MKMTVGMNFHLKQTVLIFWIKFAKKKVFPV